MAQNEAFGYDVAQPEGRALVRFMDMFGALEPALIEALPTVYREHLGPVTQALFLDFMNSDEHDAKDTLQIEDGHALARNLFERLADAGCNFNQAMSTAMTMLVRVHQAARRAVETQGGHSRTVGAAPLADIAKNQWRRLLTERIAITQTTDGEMVAQLESVPAVTITERVPNLNHLHSSEGATMVIGVGGGSDCHFARFAADELLNVPGAPVVSYPGVDAEAVHGAKHVAGPVFLATSETNFTTRRFFEGFAAETGPCYIIANTDNVAAAYEMIADHIHTSTDRPVANIVTVDSGGDILQPGNERSRDHRSLLAAGRFEAARDISVSHTLVLIPGVDAPTNIDAAARQVDARLYDVTPHAAAFRTMCERQGLPTADPRWYSQMLEIAHLALSQSAIEEGHYGLQPLQLPLDQARGKRPRPAFTVTSPSMRQALVIDNRRLRAHILRGDHS